MNLENLLNNATTIAVVGASPQRGRPSNRVVRYLISAGYSIIPVNPNYEEVEGIKTFNSILDIPADVDIDIVNIFRNPKYTLSVVEEVIERSKSSAKPVIWTQLGVSTDEAKLIAQSAGIDYVSNQCIMVTHATL